MFSVKCGSLSFLKGLGLAVLILLLPRFGKADGNLQIITPYGSFSSPGGAIFVPAAPPGPSGELASFPVTFNSTTDCALGFQAIGGDAFGDDYSFSQGCYTQGQVCSITSTALIYRSGAGYLGRDSGENIYLGSGIYYQCDTETVNLEVNIVSDFNLTLSSIQFLQPGTTQPAGATVNLVPDTPVQANVTISGSGFNTPETRTTSVILQIGSQTIGSQDINLADIQAAPGGTRTYTIPVTIDSSLLGTTQTIIATVDPGNALGESTFTDNTATTQEVFAIGPCPTPLPPAPYPVGPYHAGQCPIGCYQLPLNNFAFSATNGPYGSYIFPGNVSPFVEIQSDGGDLAEAGSEFIFTSGGESDSFSVLTPSTAQVINSINLPCAIQTVELSTYVQSNTKADISCAGVTLPPANQSTEQEVDSTVSFPFSSGAETSCSYGGGLSNMATIDAVTTTMTAKADSTNTAQPILIRQQSLTSQAPYQGDQKTVIDYLNGLITYPVGLYGCALTSATMVTAQNDPYLIASDNKQLLPVNTALSKTGDYNGFNSLKSPDIYWWTAVPNMTIQTANGDLSQYRMVFDDSQLGSTDPGVLTSYLESDGLPVIVKVHSESAKYSGKPVNSLAGKGGHFVVVWGIQNGEFMINDPAFGNTTLSQFEEFSDGPWFVIRGKAVSAFEKSTLSSRAAGSMVFGVTGANILIVDSQGSKTGIDPQNGNYIQNIPASYFGQDGIAASDGSGDMPALQYVSVPQSGTSYQVNLSGLSGSTSSFEIVTLNPNKSVQNTQLVSIPSTVGSTISFTVGSDGNIVAPAPTSKGVIEISPGAKVFDSDKNVWGLIWSRILPTNASIELKLAATLDGEYLSLTRDSRELSRFEASSLSTGLHVIQVNAYLAGKQVDDATAYLVVEQKSSK